MSASTTQSDCQPLFDWYFDHVTGLYPRGWGTQPLSIHHFNDNPISIFILSHCLSAHGLCSTMTNGKKTSLCCIYQHNRRIEIVEAVGVGSNKFLFSPQLENRFRCILRVCVSSFACFCLCAVSISHSVTCSLIAILIMSNPQSVTVCVCLALKQTSCHSFFLSLSLVSTMVFSPFKSVVCISAFSESASVSFSQSPENHPDHINTSSADPVTRPCYIADFSSSDK